MYHIEPQLYLPIGWILIMLVGVLSCIRHERREWNDGISRKSGLPWRRFDTSSQGDRGYTDDQGNYCWVSYDSVDKRN